MGAPVTAVPPTVPQIAPIPGGAAVGGKVSASANATSGPGVLGVVDAVTSPVIEATPGAFTAVSGLNLSGNVDKTKIVDLRTLKGHPKIKALIKLTRKSGSLAKYIEKTGDFLTTVKLALSAVDMTTAKTAQEYSKAVDNYMRESFKSVGSLLGAQGGVSLGTGIATSSIVPTGGLGAVVGIIGVPVLGIIGSYAGSYTAGKAYNAAHALRAGIKSIAKDYYTNNLSASSP
ncbi:MAG TPA: hypothetical protein ENJ57_08465 [Rhizobiales bacterium]|nr:hypothetical protein [Hyphomicrobiales bacterium]